MNFALVKAAALIALAVCWSDTGRRLLEGVLPRRRPWALLSVALASRLVPVWLAFGVAGLAAPGDTPGFYVAFAGDVLAGRAGTSPYSPGFNYLLAALFAIGHSPFAFVMAFVLAEVAAFAWFVSTSRASTDDDAWSLAVFWLVNPLSLFFVTLGGQDEALVLLAWSAVTWCVLSRRPVAGGVLAGIGLACTKILGVFASVPLALVPLTAMMQAAAGAGLVVGAVVAASVAHGVPLLGFLQESRLVTSGNIWSMAVLVSHGTDFASHAWQFALAAAGTGLALLVLRANAQDLDWKRVVRATGLIGAVFLLLTPKSFTQYSVMFLPGILHLILTLPRAARAAMLYVFLPASVVEPSVWFLLSEGHDIDRAWWGRPLMISLDLALLGGYVALIVQGVSAARAGRTAPARASAIAS